MNRSIYKSLIVCLTLIIVGDFSYAQTYARNGMVVSDSEIASSVGVDILKKGGNAVDAAVATAFALQVTHPAAGNIGGGGFLVFMNEEGEVTTIDFREKAPLAAMPDMYLDENGEVKGNINHLSALAIGVPGTVAGLYKAQQQYGNLEWKEVVQPSVSLAEEGFEFNWSLYFAGQYVTRQENFPFMKQYFLNENGNLTEPGEIWKQPELAKTLLAIRDNGKDGFYTGWVADEIVKFMEAEDGIITHEDLKRYDAIEREPITGTYDEYIIYSMPPPSSGGVAIVEMMNLMELADLESIEFNSRDYVHLVAEAMRRAYADRAEHLGDSDFNPDLPLERLTSKEFAKHRFESIDMTKASVSDSSRFGQLYDGESTTHLSVLDKDGNAVSLTYTLEYSYGSRMGSEALGFIFNNEMGDFNPQPGVTTRGGRIGTPPNQIAPEKRMLSSMSPTIVAKDGKPYLVIGSPGGRTIINTVFQTILNVLEYEMPVDKAIAAMKIHHQWLPDRILYERDLLSPDTRKALEAMGHTLVPRNNLGVLMGITLDPETGIMTGAADASSGEGEAVGY
jgi:gamma-glutamyltranspeptidase/glutathione hydrolase